MNSSKMHPLQAKSLLIFVALLALLSCAIIALNLTDDELSQTIAENSLDYLQNAQPKQHDPITISLSLQDKKWEVDQQAKSAFAQLLL